MTCNRYRRAGLAAALAAVSVGFWGAGLRLPVRAQQTTQPAPSQPAPSQAAVPAVPSDVTAAKAFSALDRNCASCHQAGRPGDEPAGASLDNILALNEIAVAGWLVRPGLPDASRIYNVALTGEGHLDIFNDPGQTGPLPAEVQAIRDWITELPVRPPSCSGEAGLNGRDLSALMARAVAGLEPETARLVRFLSLAHLANACVPASELERAKGVLAMLGANRAGNNPSSRRIIEPVDPRRLVWRLYLPAFGMTAEAWDRKAAGNPMSDAPGLKLPSEIVTATGTRHPVVPADWEAREAVAGNSLAGADDLLLGRMWRRPGTLARLAADLWMPVPGVERRLAGVPSALSLATHRLLGGAAVSRSDLDRLARFIVAGTAADRALPPEPLEIALWSDKGAYKAGETARFSIETNQDCYLTLIGIDGRGRGMVLYPSEFEPANRLVRGKVLQVPAIDAPYKFRFKEKGRETLVATCSTSQRSPPGLAHDFDRLRFTVLGDWELFLREPPEMKEARRDDAATDTPRPQARPRRRGRGPDAKAPAAIPEADVQTRTAIHIVIE
jgi:mono/diheme cytochrome c family protein